MILLGTKHYLDALELLLNAGLAWSVRKEETQTKSGIEIPKQIAIVREDTGTVLGTHKDGYEIFQNQQMAELLIELTQKANLQIHSAGMFGGGAKVYIQVKGENLRLGNDLIEGYGTIVNSFDGSTALGIGEATNTVSCMNSFFMAYKQLNSKIKHTKSLTVKVDDLIQSIEAVRKIEADHFNLIRKLATVEATREHLATVYDTMLKVKIADVVAQRANPKAEILSTKMVNTLDRLDVSIRKELASKDKTLWGLFSGVTHYTTHTLAEKEESKMFGTIANNERALFSKFAELVK